MQSKAELRKWIKEERKKLDIINLSKIFVEKIQTLEEYKSAKNIMLYYPLENEINLLGLLEDKNKMFYLPKISGENLLCCPYSKGDSLCESCFKTKEPVSDSVEKSLIDLVIVPALAVDKNNYRLGYGGGFYDRFLADVKVYKITCIPKKYYLSTVFPEDYDIKIDKCLFA